MFIRGGTSTSFSRSDAESANYWERADESGKLQKSQKQQRRSTIFFIGRFLLLLHGVAARVHTHTQTRTDAHTHTQLPVFMLLHCFDLLDLRCTAHEFFVL